MFDIGVPRNGKEIREEWSRLHGEIAAAVDELDLEEFLAPQGEHWSPALHIRHLVTANRALSRGMSAPRFLLAIRFGVNRKGSRSFEEVRDLYRGALAAGGMATGPYDPSRRSLDMEPEDLRALVMKRWHAAGSELGRAIDSWPETALDRYQAKHPLLGTMSVRELLYFTLYHNAHHGQRIVERRPS
ncbi:MAG: DinB family protein [Thermoanaerobaculia bacterium]